MGIFDKMKDGVNNIKNKSFLKAICAACALVAYADGEVTQDEIEKMMKYMSINDDLRSYNPSEITSTFQKYVNGIEFDVNIGKVEAYSAIQAIKNNSDQSQKLCTVCLVIAKSDGSVDKEELDVIKDICSKLGVSQKSIGLQ